MSIKSAAIIGSGITGLSAAYALRKAGLEVCVFESSDRVGGVMQSITEDGFLAEAGPNTILLNSPGVRDLLHEIDLEKSIVEARSTAKKRYIVKGGNLQAVPMSPPAFFNTKIFSTKGKLRIFKEPFIKKGSSNNEQSLADFVRCRLGREVLDYAVSPFVSGVYAGDPEKLSARYAFPRLWNLEQDYGSLFRGGIKALKARKKKGPRIKSRVISFKDGLQMLPMRLYQILGDRVHLETKLKAIIPESEWKISGSHAGIEYMNTFDAIILTVPAYQLSSLPLGENVKAELNPLKDIFYSPVSVLVFGFHCDQIDHSLDGYGMLVPKKEGKQILGTLFSSSLFPGRAPSGHVTLTTFVGGACHGDLAELPFDRMKNIVLEELDSLLGVSGKPVFERHFVWPRAIPQYNLGYGKFLARLDEIEKKYPGIYLAGSYRHGVSVSQCIEDGLNAANRIIEKNMT